MKVLVTKLAIVPEEVDKKDENGNVVKNNLGDPVKVQKLNKDGQPVFKADYTRQIQSMQVYSYADLLEKTESGALKVKVENVHAVGLIVDEKGQPATLDLDETGAVKGVEFHPDTKLPVNMDTAQSDRVIALLVNADGVLVAMNETAPTIAVDENGLISGLKLEETVRLSGKNRYDSLNSIMMILGYVFSAPFFILTVRTAQKHGHKKSLMTYVAVALICYIGVLALLMMWQFNVPGVNLNIMDGINLYTIAFILFFGIGYGAYYATADMPIPMVADCADYETYRSGKFIPGIMGTLFSLVDKLVSSLSATVVALVVGFIGISELPTKSNLYVPGMNWVVIVLFCIIPMVAWLATLWAMKGYELDGERVKEIQKINSERKAYIAEGHTLEEAMAAIPCTEK